MVGFGGAFLVGVTVARVVGVGVLVATGVAVGVAVAGNSGSVIPFKRNHTVVLLCAPCASVT